MRALRLSAEAPACARHNRRMPFRKPKATDPVDPLTPDKQRRLKGARGAAAANIRISFQETKRHFVEIKTDAHDGARYGDQLIEITTHSRTELVEKLHFLADVISSTEDSFSLKGGVIVVVRQ